MGRHERRHGPADSSLRAVLLDVRHLVGCFNFPFFVSKVFSFLRVRSRNYFLDRA